MLKGLAVEAGIDPLGRPGRRPTVDVDVAGVRARHQRGETWASIAGEHGVPVETLRRRPLAGRLDVVTLFASLRATPGALSDIAAR